MRFRTRSPDGKHANYEWVNCQVISHYIPRVNRTCPPVFRCYSYDMLYDLTFRGYAPPANANSARVTHARSDIGSADRRRIYVCSDFRHRIDHSSGNAVNSVPKTIREFSNRFRIFASQNCYLEHAFLRKKNLAIRHLTISQLSLLYQYGNDVYLFIFLYLYLR